MHCKKTRILLFSLSQKKARKLTPDQYTCINAIDAFELTERDCAPIFVGALKLMISCLYNDLSCIV